MAKLAVSGNAPKATKVSRPGTHSKTVSSKLKSSKNYKKKYVGQGGKR
jgi:hypothetical protein